MGAGAAAAGNSKDDKPDDEIAGAQTDAAEIVRLAFAQAERINREAQEARDEAARLLEQANKEAAEIREGVQAERERLLADAQRDRVAAEEALLQARADAEREAETVMQRAGELARREAEILLDGSRLELLRARDEAAAIRATAERDAESIVAAATQRARSTSAELLAATRRRLGDAAPATEPARARPLRAAGNGETTSDPVVDLTDDRPPAVEFELPPTDGALALALEPADTGPPVKLGGWAVPLLGPHAPTRMVMFADRRYRMNWEKTPTDEDVDVLVRQAVSKAVARSFARRRRRRTALAAHR